MQIVTVPLSALLQSVEEMWLTNFIVYVKGEPNTALARIARGSNIWFGLQLCTWTFYKVRQKSTCLHI